MSVEQALQVVRRRLRAARALRLGVVGAIAASPLGAALAAYHLAGGDPSAWLAGLSLEAACLLPAGVGGLLGVLWGLGGLVSDSVAAEVLGHRGGRGAVFSTLLELEAAAHPWAGQVRREAEVALASIDPRRAASLRAPRSLRWLLAALALICLLSSLPPVAERIAPAEAREVVALSESELVHVRRISSRLDRTSDAFQAPALRQVAERLDALAERIEGGQLTRLDALSRLGGIEEELRRERRQIAARVALASEIARSKTLETLLTVDPRSSPIEAADRADARAALERASRAAAGDVELQRALSRAAEALREGASPESAAQALAELQQRVAELPPESWDVATERESTRGLEELEAVRASLAGDEVAEAEVAAADPADASDESHADASTGAAADADSGEGSTIPNATEGDSAEESPADGGSVEADPAGGGSAEPKPAEDGSAEPKPAEDGSAEPKPAEDGSAAGGSAETEPAQDGSAAGGSAETEPAERGSAESEPAEGGSTEPEPAERGSAESEPAERGSAESEPAERGSAESEPAEGGSTEPEPAEGGSAESEPAEGGSTESEPAEGGSTEPEPAEGGSTEPEPAEGGSAEPEPGEADPGEADPESRSPKSDQPKPEPKDTSPGESRATPEISPFMLDMAKSLVENMDPETLRDLAEALRPEDGPAGEPPQVPPNIPPGVKDLIEAIDPEQLKKLGEAFKDMAEKQQGSQRAPEVSPEFLERLAEIDPETLRRLGEAMPEQQQRDGQPGQQQRDGQPGQQQRNEHPGQQQRNGQPGQQQPDGQPGRQQRDGLPGQQPRDGQSGQQRSSRGEPSLDDRAVQDAAQELLERVDAETLRRLAQSRAAGGQEPQLPKEAERLLEGLSAEQLETLAKAASKAEERPAAGQELQRQAAEAGEAGRRLLEDLERREAGRRLLEDLKRRDPKLLEKLGDAARKTPGTWRGGSGAAGSRLREDAEPKPVERPREREILLPDAKSARRVQAVGALGVRRARVPFSQVPPAVIEEATRSLERQRVPEGYDRAVRDYFSRWRRAPAETESSAQTEAASKAKPAQAPAAEKD